MFRSKGFGWVAACAALAVSQGARAAYAGVGSAPSVSTPLFLDPTVNTPASSALPTNTPLMQLLDAVGVGKGIEGAGFVVNGYVEGGYTYDFSSPSFRTIDDRSFDQRHDSPVLDQMQLNIQRTVDFTRPFDLGVQIEQIYGTDSAYIHSNGLALVSNAKQAGPFTTPGGGTTPTINPRAQYDLTQANFTLSSSRVAKGIALVGGKFDALVGYETIEPYAVTSEAPTFNTLTPFYSHSFIFSQEPFTQTGLLGIIKPVEQLTVTTGITRGWDQATEDTNGNIDLVGKVAWAVTPKLNLNLGGITGNEQPDVPFGVVGHNGWRSLIDVNGAYALSDQLSLGFNGMYAWEAQTGNAGNGGGTGQWYGLAGYAGYKQSDYLTFSARAEWFNDPEGAAPNQYVASVRRPNEYYEFTLGMTIHPLPNTDLLNNFFVRPEVRFDYADNAEFDPDTTTGLPTDHYFFTFGVDGVYAF